MSVSRSWRGVAGVAAWQVVASASYYGVFAATASIRSEYGLSSFQIGILLATLTLGYTLFLFPAGAFVDGYGDKPVMVVGLVGLGLGGIGVSMADDILSLLVAVFLLGSMYAAAMPATNRAIAARSPSGRYNLAINVKQVGVTGGSALAAVFLTNIQTFGGTWHLAYQVIGITALLVGGIAVVGFSNTGGSGTLTFPDIGRLRGNRPYLLLALSGLFVGAAIFSTTGYLVPYFEESGSGLQLAGIALATMQVAGSSGRLGAGSLADRLSKPNPKGGFLVMIAQLSIAVGMLATLPLVPVSSRFPVVIGLGLALLGLTGLFHGTLVALVPNEHAGAATAGGQTLINVGGLIVPPLFGLLVDGFGYTYSWWLLALLAGIGVTFLISSYRTL